MVRHVNRSKKRRALACGPPSKCKVVAHLPPLFTQTDKHGNPMTIDDRRWKLPVPKWCEAASSFRPSTNQFTATADRIASINYHAYKRSSKYQRKQEVGYQHYQSTAPAKAKPMYHPLSGHKPILPLITTSHSEPSIAFTTSWLEPVVDEAILDDQFEQHIRENGPIVRTLLRTNRKKQKDWDKNLDAHRDNIGAKKRRHRNKPQKWIPRTDPAVKLPGVQAWLNRHAQQEQAAQVKKETSEAIKNNPRGRRRRRKRGGGGGGGGRVKKKKTTTTTTTSKIKSHFLGSGSMDDIGWFDTSSSNKKKKKKKELTEYEKMQLERLEMLERKTKTYEKIHSKKFNTCVHNYHKVPKTLVNVDSSGLITGGVRFVSRVPRVVLPLGRRTKTAAHYVSPLLLPHERD